VELAVDTPKHSVSVAGVVVRPDGSILVVQRRDNARWEPPGGVLELEESFEAGVRREVLEETGVDVAVERLTGVYKNMSRGVVALVFRCSPVAGELMPTSESQRVQWLSLSQVEQRMSPAFAIRVLDALKPSGSAIRIHDGVNILSS
jgi:8-oxo-dGTP diphosphatase